MEEFRGSTTVSMFPVVSTTDGSFLLSETFSGINDSGTLTNGSNMNTSWFDTNVTSTVEYVLPHDFIIWKLNERQFYINLPSFCCIAFAIVLGIFGNGTVIYVFGFKLKRNNTNKFTTWLAVSDFIMCLALNYEMYDKRYPMYSGHFVFLCKAVRYVLIVANSASGFLLLCIAFDRYFKVCKPLKRFSSKRTTHAIIAAFLAPVLTVWPMAIFHGPEKRPTAFEGVYGVDCADDEQYEGSIYRKLFYFFCLVVVITCIVILIVIYLRIFFAIRKWRKFAVGESDYTRSRSEMESEFNQTFVTQTEPTEKTGGVGNGNIGEGKRTKTGGELRWKEDVSQRVTLATPIPQDDDMVYTIVRKPKTKDRIAAKCTKMKNCLKSCRRETSCRRNSSLAENEKLPTERKRRESDVSSNAKDSRRGKKKTKSRRGSNVTTIMFSLVSVLYIVSFLPTIVMEALNTLGVVYEADMSDQVIQLVVLTNVSYFMNGSFNPIIYLIYNRSFREKLWSFFVRR